jgi:hypothetical protein
MADFAHLANFQGIEPVVVALAAPVVERHAPLFRVVKVPTDTKKFNFFLWVSVRPLFKVHIQAVTYQLHT